MIMNAGLSETLNQQVFCVVFFCTVKFFSSIVNLFASGKTVTNQGERNIGKLQRNGESQLM